MTQKRVSEKDLVGIRSRIQTLTSDHFWVVVGISEWCPADVNSTAEPHPLSLFPSSSLPFPFVAFSSSQFITLPISEFLPKPSNMDVKIHIFISRSICSDMTYEHFYPMGWDLGHYTIHNNLLAYGRTHAGVITAAKVGDPELSPARFWFDSVDLAKSKIMNSGFRTHVLWSLWHGRSHLATLQVQRKPSAPSFAGRSGREI